MPAFLLSTRSAVVLDWIGSLLMAGAVWSWLYGIIGPPLNGATLKAGRQKAFTDFAGLMSAWLDKYDEQQYDKYRISIWRRARGVWYHLVVKVGAGFFGLKYRLWLLLSWLAKTVFVGRMGQILFLVGFAMWNLSKVSSYISGK